MTTYRVQHALQSRSGSSKDQFVNTFHFEGEPNMPGADIEALAGHVKDFFTGDIGGSFGSLTGWLSNMAMGPGRTVKVYDMTGPPPHAPLFTDVTFAELAVSTQQQLPEEVAVCLSYEGLRSNGQNLARRRGRIYFGPLNVNCVQGGNATSLVYVNPPVADCLTAAAAKLMGDALGNGFTWSVHSPTNGNNVTIARVWVDNTFDTVRGRGHFSSARVVQEGPPFDV